MAQSAPARRIGLMKARPEPPTGASCRPPSRSASSASNNRRSTSPRPSPRSLAGLDIAYQPMKLRIINNGHTIQVNAAPGSSCVIGGTSYELQQFHFHHPSEHLLSGKPFDLECHLVHRSAARRVIDQGEYNLEPIWRAMRQNRRSADDRAALLSPACPISSLPRRRAGIAGRCPPTDQASATCCRHPDFDSKDPTMSERNSALSIFTDRTIGTKIAAGFAVVLLVLAVSSVLAWLAFGRASRRR